MPASRMFSALEMILSALRAFFIEMDLNAGRKGFVMKANAKKIELWKITAD